MKDIRLHSTLNSWCIICSRIFYGKVHEKCPSCGGLCHTKSDEDMAFMGRRGMIEVEARAQSKENMAFKRDRR